MKQMLDTPLFQGLSSRIKDELFLMGSVRQWKRNDYLFLAGSPVKSIFYLLHGKIKEYYSDGFGDEFLRRIFYPENYISLHSVIDNEQNYSYNCMVVRSAECFILPAKPFHDLLRKEPELALKVATLLCREYENSCRKNCLCKKKQPVSRVAGYLLSKQGSPGNIKKGYCDKQCCKGQVDLRPIGLAASDVCLARETFSRALITLHEQNVVSSNRGVVDILDEETLKVICGIA